MKDITRQAMDVLMKRAPVWAASMAGRTRVFETDDVPTAAVTGSGGRFKIVINPAMMKDFEFVLMHEVAHIFRRDITSMQNNKQIAPNINVAADCIINDSLLNMGVPVSGELRKNGCFGNEVYRMDCSGKSINDLLEVTYPPEAESKATAPGKATPNGEDASEDEGSGAPGQDEGDEKGEPSVGENPLGYTGVGGGQTYGDPTQLARSLVGYARRMFFERGFKSKNMSTKYDWRRNRSAFTTRTDVVIPRQTVGEYGHNTEGPLVNLVLDVSGSMDPSWVATAGLIAEEIGKAGLEYDLWLTPSRAKAKNPKRVIQQLKEGGYVGDLLEPMSNSGMTSHPSHLEERKGPRPSRSKVSKLAPEKCMGANELDEIPFMNTEDPVVWVYIGDYKSRMQYEMMFDRNFLHVPMVDDRECPYPKKPLKSMVEHSLPRWEYPVR